MSFDYEGWNSKNHIFQNEDIRSIELGSSVENDIPQVTFAIPAYKRADSIVDTIRSIAGQKSMVSFIIMVIDDSGEDRAVADRVLELIRTTKNIILYKNEKNIGQAANWNRCIELTKSKWLVLIHDDDMVCPDYLENVYPIAEKYHCSEVGVFQYKLDKIDHEGMQADRFNGSQAFAQRILSRMRHGKAFEVYERDIFQFVTPSPGCWFINREEAIKRGGFNPDFGVTLDGIFHFGNICYGRTFIIPKFLMIRRIEENTFLKETSQIAVIDMLYHFGEYNLKNYSGIRRGFYRILLEISSVYLGNGINAKYGGKIDVRSLLREYGVRKWVLYLPGGVVYLLNCILLSKLIFRKRRN